MSGVHVPELPNVK